ncbi:bifunctional hydroxymethylpyrimidine kinase/phosphomethylpyrimidine kinase [Chloroflexia bacterium SDU3-3]|nr:bifunctional hydroxymethylpyrimidine kinase/phosphomethylpyrimidine kinase [Chloroflexia bacterium SDU3-3]
MRKVLSIAGSDSGGGAGIQADLKACAAHGVYCATALTAVTAQNTLGVTAVQLLPPPMVEAQIAAVLSDIGADAVKTGMLGDAAIIAAVAAALGHFGVRQLVVDPVMVAKGGDQLLARDAVAALRELLLPRALLLTPNLPEAEVLLGRAVRREQDMRDAARDLLAMGPQAVLLKGGHLEGEPVDVLCDGAGLVELRSRRVDTPNTHGTGCTYAAAIAALLALGAPLREAVARAHAYLAGAIAHAVPLGGGHGPVNHLYRGMAYSELG